MSIVANMRWIFWLKPRRALLRNIANDNKESSSKYPILTGTQIFAKKIAMLSGTTYYMISQVKTLEQY